MRSTLSLFALLGALLAGLSSAARELECSIRLVDATKASGVTFLHTDGGNGQQYIVEFTNGGLALFDYDGDDLIDIYLLNGAALKGTALAKTPRNALYRNNGDGTFTDVTEAAGVGDRGYGMGVAVADYDDDGDQDLYLSNYGPNVLYRNNGDGTFQDVTHEARAACGDKLGAGVSFLDIERDGDLDLYVGHYVDFTYERHAALAPKAHPFPPGPHDFAAVPDMLLRNEGDGTFTDVSEESGVGMLAGRGMGLVSGDFDADADTDIFVCNDAEANFLWVNDGSGRFQEQAVAAGVAFDLLGNPNGSMGVDCADYDHDGWLDLYVTDYTGELPVLYRNLGDGFFEDATRLAQAGRRAFPHVNWGTGLADFDNDGSRDLFIANGHFLKDIQKTDARTDYRVANMLLMNRNGLFVDVSERCGDGLSVVESSRGAAFNDLDNDGDVDAVVLNVGTRPTVLQNASRLESHWLQIRLCGLHANRDGVGAKARVVASDLVQTAEVHSGRGYQSHYGTRLHFGLHDRTKIDRVEVDWPSGHREVFQGLPIDQLVILREGTGEEPRGSDVTR